ncbi:Uncharacterised protein [Streptococcus pneumoniae]|nr:Uncharacterised protein [Streptococcus pneumoniae]VJZ06778.1 Uncharacterised protein [Streptococcus pneumoniae]VKI98972.1 Uncharacterised protein [Streptococcus pneumoniae]VKV52608.1 Uncharacterised protein [Streptococcus pneumoniae]VLR46413.1 Uncharacterised protein [Streptococcus pneumoniae]
MVFRFGVNNWGSMLQPIQPARLAVGASGFL